MKLEDDAEWIDRKSKQQIDKILPGTAASWVSSGYGSGNFPVLRVFSYEATKSPAL
jgi:hypothetical protein